MRALGGPCAYYPLPILGLMLLYNNVAQLRQIKGAWLPRVADWHQSGVLSV